MKVQGQIDKLDERFVLSEISKEQFEKYTQKFELEKRVLVEENDNCQMIQFEP